MKKQIHEGHRRRLINKFLADVEISDVELIEILLFYVIPRRDVRRQAEDLIERYDCAARALETDMKALLNVNGIGETSAEFLIVFGKIMSKIHAKSNETKTSSEPKSLFNLTDSLAYLNKFFFGVKIEFTVIVYLDAIGRPIHASSYTDNKRNAVDMVPFDCTDDIARYKPNAAIIAHNHFISATPSSEDDTTTMRLMMIMNSHSVKLYDHIIICGKRHYSYFHTGRLEKFRERMNETLYGRDRA